MPELPEVETMVRTLRPRITGRTLGTPRILRESAIEKVFCGLTTLREINKVTFVE